MQVLRNWVSNGFLTNIEREVVAGEKLNKFNHANVLQQTRRGSSEVHQSFAHFTTSFSVFIGFPDNLLQMLQPQQMA